MEKWTRVNYLPNLPLGENGKKVTASKEHITLSKNAAKEGMVLLKNENQVLPLKPGCKVALFGKGTVDYVKGGGGSGDVTVSYVRNLAQGLKALDGKVQIFEPLVDFYEKNVKAQYEEGAMPGLTKEPALDETLVKQAKAFTDTAIISISRFSGEGWDRRSDGDEDLGKPDEYGADMHSRSAAIFKRSDFYLTQEEEAMMDLVKMNFDKVIVVMNVGGMVDSAWMKEDDLIDAVLMAWQGGMEGGLAAAELLVGMGNPSGKLADTFARNLADYPSSYNFHESANYVDYTDDIYVGYRYFQTIPSASEKIIYPFGYGLSYTTFDVDVISVQEEQGVIKACVNVTNTGALAGKEVVQVYVEAPQGALGKPKRVLTGFQKTRCLQPGETQVVFISFPVSQFASYDDLGKVAKSAYVLEKGTYVFHIGTSAIDTVEALFHYEVEEDIVVEQLSAKLVPTSLRERMLSDGSFEALPLGEPNDPDENIFTPMTYEQTEGYTPAQRAISPYLCFKGMQKEGIKTLKDVADGNCDLDTFVKQLSDEDLAYLLGGQPNTGVANTFGYGNLPAFGVPSVMTADGPAGLRITPNCSVNTTAFPCSTLLACSFHPETAYQVGAAGGAEVKENNIAVWLTPAVNIHRSPLCGRNFEYYSEDPYLTGKMAAAMVQGIQSQNVGATVKHFACNNKETNRKNSDSRVSERAAREIYLKAFEIIVKEADPWSIMTSYNIINGHRASENVDLLEGILRNEWHYEGMVTTDWWTAGEHYKETNAGNDVKMGCGYPERLLEAMKRGMLTREQMEICGKRILSLILKID